MSDVSLSLRGRLDHAEVADNPRVWQPEFISCSRYVSVWVSCGLCPTSSLCGSGCQRPHPLGSWIIWNTCSCLCHGKLKEGWRAPLQNLNAWAQKWPMSLLLTFHWQQQILMSIVMPATPPQGYFSSKAKLESLIKELLNVCNVFFSASMAI